MGKLQNIITSLHTKTERGYFERMRNEKVACAEIARKFDKNFWDGDRKYGYGGYKYDGRWAIPAKKLIELYDLQDGASILDVGCGKGDLPPLLVPPLKLEFRMIQTVVT